MAERAFLVCATPRSGSTLVCQALRKSGVAGVPDEYFEALLHAALAALEQNRV
jgi:LPS sulfotransferase NodH